jgi:Fe-Mn family superoxide dismutase
MNRRDFIVTTGIAGLGISILPTASCKNPNPEADQSTDLSGAFTQPELGYAYSDLEPYIDAQTMEIHYSKHHAGYVRKLNAAIENHPLKGQDLDQIMTNITADAADTGVLNNGGGHYNHSLFWKIMTPGGSDQMNSSLLKAIEKQFGSKDKFLDQFGMAAATVFGSGWAWLSVDANQQLFVSATRNQENPAMQKVVKQPGKPILGIDVWEHAYYLKYQNRRKEYISNFLQTINWDVVGENFDKAM